LIRGNYRDACGIIYCTSKKSCEETTQKLINGGVKSAFYHAGLDPRDRNRIQMDWINNKTQVIVATIAFGMGIDKADVRFVIHYSMPSSLEGYYQETGRAGRDGKKSLCVLYYSYNDSRRIESMIDSGDGSNSVKDGQRYNLRQVVQYAENKIECRRVQVLQYFSETFKKEQCNKTCDNCQNNFTYEKVDITEDTKHIVRLVRDLQASNVTITHCVDVFRGSQNQKVMSSYHNELSSYGKGKQYIKADVERMFHYLITEEVLYEKCERGQMGYVNSYIQIGKKAYSHGKVVFSFIKDSKNDSKENIEELGAIAAAKKRKSTSSSAKASTLSSAPRTLPFSNSKSMPIRKQSLELSDDDAFEDPRISKAKKAKIQRPVQKSEARLKLEDSCYQELRTFRMSVIKRYHISAASLSDQMLKQLVSVCVRE